MCVLMCMHVHVHVCPLDLDFLATTLFFLCKLAISPQAKYACMHVQYLTWTSWQMLWANKGVDITLKVSHFWPCIDMMFLSFFSLSLSPPHDYLIAESFPVPVLVPVKSSLAF